MSDRELLELADNADISKDQLLDDPDYELLLYAAKAANLKVIWSNNLGRLSTGTPYCEDDESWDPIENDSDALRLAVALRLEIGINPGTKKTRVFLKCETLENSIGITQQHDDDPIAATRYAIVRAAAEIGRRL